MRARNVQPYVGRHPLSVMWPQFSKRTIPHTIAATRALCQFPAKQITVSKFDFPLATHTAQQVLENGHALSDSRKVVVLNGHLHKKPRSLAARIFAELRDSSGSVCHLLVDPDTAAPSVFTTLKQSLPEESVSVSGYVKRKVVNPNDPDGAQWELVVRDYQVLNTSNMDASRLDKLKHTSPTTLPPQHRYLQLRMPQWQRALKVRSQASHVMRSVLVETHGFTEIETPLLFKSTPEGAREFLVPTRQPAKFYALPQSPQQYKQMLMLSGFTRYFQFAKCFRDEDLRADRQPEFTQIDLELAYVNNSVQVRHVVEDVVQCTWNRVGNMPIYTLDGHGDLVPAEATQPSSLAFASITYHDALAKYGIDKPDLRSALEFVSLTGFFAPAHHPDFPVVEVCILRAAFDPETSVAKDRIPKALRDKASYPSRTPIIVAITAENMSLWYRPYIGRIVVENPGFSECQLAAHLNLRPGDIIAFSQRAALSYENPTPLGKFRQLAIEQYPGKWRRPVKVDGKLVSSADAPTPLFVGAWVVDFPLFSPVETGTAMGYPQYGEQLESTHHPFTMAKTDDYDLLQTNPLQVRAEHYDLVINGVEVGGGLRRVHDARLQQYIFEKVLRVTNYHDLFGHLLKALDMGCPPHAGLALGFDRLCAMLVGLLLIRDVIAFPKNSAGVDPVVSSPSLPSALALAEYNIGVINEK